MINPLPDAQSIQAWYGSEYFTTNRAAGMGAEYLDESEAGMRQGTENFRQFSGRVRLRGRRLLEIGCGGGAFLVQCRRAGAEVAGLELSPFAAQRLIEKYGLDVRVGVAEAAPFEPGAFDIVAFNDVMEHVLSPSAFVKGIHTLLKPGGQVFGLLPNLDCTAHYGPTWAGFRLHAEHLYYFGRSQLERCLKQAGFEVQEIWTWGEPWEPAAPRASAEDKTTAKPQPTGPIAMLRSALTSLVKRNRIAYQAAGRVREWLVPEVRKRHSRYRAGQGHDLYFLATKK
jgi:SAM-dependent methyltransferase